MRYKSDARREQILEATESFFRRGLDHEVTVDDVARRAQVSKGSIYTYFPDKDALLFQAELWRMERLVGELEATVPLALPFHERLRLSIRHACDFFDERLPILTPREWVFGREGPENDARRQRWRETMGVMLDYLAALMEQGLREGALRPEVAPRQAARFLMLTMRARKLDALADPDNAPSPEEALEYFLNGVAVAEASDAVEMELPLQEASHA